MKAEELRIGNFVRVGDTACRVVAISEEGIEQVRNIGGNTLTFSMFKNDIIFEPIPITEEWLLRFGLIKKPKTNIYLNPMFSIGEKILKLMAVHLDDNSSTIAIVDYYTETEKSDLLHLDYQFIHQLQNIFFALCGEELKLKEQ